MQVKILPYNYQNSRNTPAFGQKYPYADIMTIMSGSYVKSIQESSEKTVASILNKPLGNDSIERFEDGVAARRILWTNRPDLMPFAESFEEALNKINKNHFAIKPQEAQQAIESEIQKFGSRFIDIEL